MKDFLKSGLLNILRNIGTDADGDFCVTTGLAIAGFIADTYKFCGSSSTDWVGYGSSVAAIAAIVAAKRYSERH